MNILMAFDKKYMNPAMVTILSAAMNYPCAIDVYVMHSELDTNCKDRLNELAQTIPNLCIQKGILDKVSVQMHYIDISAEYFMDNQTLGWISKETYYRLLAQKLLPEDVDRILWLDCDVVVKEQISSFYNMDFEGKLLIASTKDREGDIHEHYRTRCYLPVDHRYFNAGVLLYNMTEQRKQLDPDIYENYLKVFDKYLPYADQDILNAVFYKLTKYVDANEYNFMPAFIDKLGEEGKKRLRDAKIIHYNGGFGKPWEETYLHTAERYFWKYAILLPEYAGMKDELQKKHRLDRRRYLRRLKKQKEKTITEKR